MLCRKGTQDCAADVEEGGEYVRMSLASLFMLSRCISFVSGANVQCVLVGMDVCACLSVSLPSFGAERKKC